MAFIQLGTDSQLQFKIPTKNTTNWSDQLKSDFFQKLVEHDHSGTGGKGAQLGANAIQDNSIIQTKIRLDNATFLRGRNAADTNDVNIIGVDASNNVQLGDGTSDIDIDATQINLTAPTIDIAASNIDVSGDTTRLDKLQVSSITARQTATITTAGTTSISSFDGTKSQILEYKMTFSGQTQVGTLKAHTFGSVSTESFFGDDLGVDILVLGGTDIELDTNSLVGISGGNPLTIEFLLKEI